jgi:hypothetical protein
VQFAIPQVIAGLLILASIYIYYVLPEVFCCRSKAAALPAVLPLSRRAIVVLRSLAAIAESADTRAMPMFDGFTLSRDQPERVRQERTRNRQSRSCSGLVRIHRRVLHPRRKSPWGITAVVIHRSASCRQLSSCKTGLRLRGQRIRLHNPGLLEGEISGEAQLRSK